MKGKKLNALAQVIKQSCLYFMDLSFEYSCSVNYSSASQEFCRELTTNLRRVCRIDGVGALDRNGLILLEKTEIADSKAVKKKIVAGPVFLGEKQIPVPPNQQVAQGRVGACIVPPIKSFEHPASLVWCARHAPRKKFLKSSSSAPSGACVISAVRQSFPTIPLEISLRT